MKVTPGVILAVIGGILALIGPFLTSSTIMSEIGAMKSVSSPSWVEDYPITYLCVAGGALAVVIGIAATLRPKISLVWGVLLAVSVIMVALGLVMAQTQAGEDIGSESLTAGQAMGHAEGEGGVEFADLPVPIFKIVSAIGSYCLVAGIVLLAFSTPLVALKK